MRHMKSLFFTAWLQVFLVALNTWQIANGRVFGALVVGFLLSFTWTFNIKSVAFGGWRDRWLYSAGACCGTGSGLFAAWILY